MTSHALALFDKFIRTFFSMLFDITPTRIETATAQRENNEKSRSQVQCQLMRACVFVCSNALFPLFNSLAFHMFRIFFSAFLYSTELAADDD